MKAINKKLGLLAICAGALTLVACGGDSATVPLTVTTVAATGLAIVNADATVQCRSGSSTAPVKTDAFGSATFTLNNATGPCLVKVTYGNVTLYSISRTTTNGNVQANVTPVSDAIVKALVARGATQPSDLVTNPNYIPEDYQLRDVVRVVLADINAALVGAGQPKLPDDYDLLGDSTFKAATDSTSGSIFDIALDTLVPQGSTSLPPDLLTTITQTVGNVVITPTGGTGAGI